MGVVVGGGVSRLSGVLGGTTSVCLDAVSGTFLPLEIHRELPAFLCDCLDWSIYTAHSLGVLEH
jgi:hypothetical protein